MCYYNNDNNDVIKALPRQRLRINYLPPTFSHPLCLPKSIPINLNVKIYIIYMLITNVHGANDACLQ